MSRTNEMIRERIWQLRRAAHCYLPLGSQDGIKRELDRQAEAVAGATGLAAAEDFWKEKLAEVQRQFGPGCWRS